MAFDLKGTISKVAPWLGAALGGPLGAAAGKLVAAALGGDPTTATTEELAKLVQNITPEQLLALKQADQVFQLQLKQMDINEVKDLEALAVEDRKSARERQALVRDVTPQVLAYLALTVWASMNGFLLYMAYKGQSLPIDMSPLIMRVLGTMDALMGMAFAFFFGTSAGSRSKDQMLYHSTPTDGGAK